MADGQAKAQQPGSKIRFYTYGVAFIAITILSMMFGMALREFLRPLPPPDFFNPISITLPDEHQKNAAAPASAARRPQVSGSAPTLQTSGTQAIQGPISVPPAGSALVFNGFDGFQRIVDRYRQYQRDKATRPLAESKETLKAITEDWSHVKMDYMDYLNARIKKDGLQAGIPDDRADALFDRMFYALLLEPMVLEQDWEGAFYYCRNSEREFSWNTELYFLKMMGPRGYLMLLKRAPIRYWHDKEFEINQREIRRNNPQFFRDEYQDKRY